MKNVLLWLMLFSVIALSAQKQPILDKFGVNIQKHSIDQVYLKKNNPTYKYNVLKNITKNLRYFHQMEDDYIYVKGRNPKNTPIDYAGFDSGLPFEKLPKGGFPFTRWTRAYNAPSRLLNAVNDGFNVQASLMVFNNQSGRIYSFPNRYWHFDDLQQDSLNKYGYALAALWDSQRGKAANVIEIGNENWGHSTPRGNRMVLEGLKNGFSKYYGTTDPNEWGIQLASSAVQTKYPNCKWGIPFGGCDFIESFMSAETFKGDTLKYISIHPYSFRENTLDLIEHPESNKSEFWESLMRLKLWRKVNKVDSKVMVTEFGWDSKTVGELAQSSYLIRSMFMMGAMEFIDRAYWYEDIDNPTLGELYGSSGLLTSYNGVKRQQGTPKQAYRSILQLKNVIGDCWIEKKYEENGGAYAYKIKNSEGQEYFVAWIPSKIIGNKAQSKLISIDVDPTINNLANYWEIDGDIALGENLESIEKGKERRARYFRKQNDRLYIEASQNVRIFQIGIPQAMDTVPKLELDDFFVPKSYDDPQPEISFMPEYGNGALEKSLNGKLSSIQVTSSNPPTFVINANFQSSQNSVSDIQINDKVVTEYLSDAIVFNIDSRTIVDGNNINLTLTLLGDQSFPVLAFPTIDAAIMRVTTNEGLYMDTESISEFIENRMYNANMLKIDAAISTAVGVNDSIVRYDAGNGFYVTGQRGITITYQGAGTGNYTVNIPFAKRLISWYKYFANSADETNNGTINITYNFVTDKFDTGRENALPKFYWFLWFNESGNQYIPRNADNGKSTLESMKTEGTPSNGTSTVTFSNMTGVIPIGLCAEIRSPSQ